MRDDYDFSNAKRNPYVRRLKRPLTIRPDSETVAYFAEMSQKTGLPLATVISLYLRECAQSKKKLAVVRRSRRTSKSS